MAHIPRIGQEVLVQFLESDIDRPIVIGALYNGQGEAGVSPSPGGSEADPTDASLYAQAMDRSASAQGNLAGGNSPAWHGASADAQGHRNAAGLSGHKSKEFGGAGYNQLVMDDHDDQLRTQLATTQAATQLTLGHLIHQADNHRGSFRGQGFELRTDAYGAIRGQAGLFLSTYGGSDPIQSAQPAGDHSPGQALLKQASALAQAHSQIAATHLTVKLASVEGVTQAHQSQLDPQAAPLPALLQSTSGMVTGKDIHTAQSDAAAKQTTPSDGAIPHSTDALLAITAQGGIGSVAGQDLHWSAGETITLAQGQDLNLAIGSQWRLHTGQAIGVLAGASKAGDNNAGLTMIAAKGPVDIQAQADELKLQSKNQLKLASANANIDFAAAKSVTLKTAQGAAITIEGGNITVTAPGNITVNAGKKSFVGAAKQNYPLPEFPTSTPVDVPVVFNMVLSDVPGPHGEPLPMTDWRIVRAKDDDEARMTPDTVLSGTSDARGKLILTEPDNKTLVETYHASPGRLWLVYGQQAKNLKLTIEQDHWNNDDKFYQSLDAMGYTDTYQTIGEGTDVDASHSGFARTDLATNSGTKLLITIKGKA